MPGDASAAFPLDSEDADFLGALATACQRAQMYPDGHPTLERAVDHLFTALSPLLSERPATTFAVGPSQLFMGSGSSESEQPVLRDLAGRLFRRNLGAVRFARGITRAELLGVLAAVAREGGDPWQLRLPHVGVEPLGFHALSLETEETEGGLEPTPVAQAWSALAALLLGQTPGQSTSPSDADTDVAAPYDARPLDPARDREVVDALHRLGQAGQGLSLADWRLLRTRVARLVRDLRPETLERWLRHDRALHGRHLLARRLLEHGGGEVTLRVLESVARCEAQAPSGALRGLLSRLERHAEHGPSASRYRAEEEIAGLVRELVASWEGHADRHAEPVEYLPPPLVSGLERQDAYRSEPFRLLAMQLDLGLVGDSARQAVATLVARGALRPLVAVLDVMPADDPTGQAYRALLASAGVLEAVLAAVPVDIDLAERLAPEAGESAIPLLLDAMARSEERSVRRRLLQLLPHFGNAVVPHVTSRLPQAAWYVQRNLLRLLQMLPDPPDVRIAEEFARHPDTRVRVEGFRLLLRHPEARARGIVEALSDPDSSGIRVAVLAAGEDCPPAAAPLLLDGLRKGRIDPGLVASAIRALGPMVHQPGVVELLLEHAGRKLPLLGWRIAPPSKETAAALAALARHWHTDPRAGALLARARRHPDPSIRAAVTT